jgi:N-acetylmuramoyl-L-alanine amidase
MIPAVTLRRVLGLLLSLLAGPLLARAADPVILLTETERRELPVVVHGEAEYVNLEQVVAGSGVKFSPDARSEQVALSANGREVIAYVGKSLATVGGELRLLSAPVRHEQGKFLVPADSVPRLLGPLLGKRADWRAANRVLVLGNVTLPQVSVATSASGEQARVVFEASERVAFHVLQEQGRVTVSVQRDAVDTTFTQQRLTGGIVDQVQWLGGRENVFAVTLGRRFQAVKAIQAEGPPARLTLEFQAAGAAPATGQASPEPTRPTVPAAPVSSGLRVVVIDPGHGGPEVGAAGPGGHFEKDVTLAISRKLRGALANSLGVQVFLTREGDQDVPLDDRAAIANNYKADLFLSIHCNASRASVARGSEVYFLSYQATDAESRRVATLEGLANAPGTAPGTEVPAGSDLGLILWDMAQAAHLEESSALASRLQEDLAAVTGAEVRGVKQAPFRVLVGAAMPAVLVEVAFITNPEEEKLLASEAYQDKVVAALAQGVARYARERSVRAAGLDR